jgi:hypothetical protein
MISTEVSSLAAHNTSLHAALAKVFEKISSRTKKTAAAVSLQHF